MEEPFQHTFGHLPRPDLLVPVPTLEFDFRISAKVNTELSYPGDVHSEIVCVQSGKWSGTFGNGYVSVCILYTTASLNSTYI